MQAVAWAAAQVLDRMKEAVKPGITKAEFDKEAERIIRKAEVVYGIPNLILSLVYKYHLGKDVL